MPRVRLEARNVEKLAAPPSTGGPARIDYFDTVTPGFHLRVSDTGARSYAVLYRTREGLLRRYTIGPVGDTDLSKARDRAKDIKAEARLPGGDPQGDKVRARKAAASSGDESLAALVADYLREAGPQLRPATLQDWTRYFNKEVLPKLGKLRAAGVTAKQVEALVERIRDGVVLKTIPATKGRPAVVVWKRRPAPIAAARCFAALRVAYNWALSKARWREKLSSSPCASLKTPGQAKRRDRTLNPDELRALFEHLPGTEIEGFVDVALHTATRVSETTSAKWTDIDFARRTWTIPAERAKSDEKRDVPLSVGALKALADIRARGNPSDWVFATTELASGHLDKDFVSREMRALGKAAGVPDVRAHDLRRTVANGMRNDLSIAPHVIEYGCLGHTAPALLRTYMPGLNLAETRRAFDAWSRHLETIRSGKKTRKVVGIRG
jgi:integrase